MATLADAAQKTAAGAKCEYNMRCLCQLGSGRLVAWLAEAEAEG